MNAKVKLAVGILCLFICGGLRPAHAALETDIWNGGTGSWTNAAEWSLNVVPNNNSSSNYVVLIDNGNPINSSVELDPFVTITINRLVLDAGDSLTINTGATLDPTNSLTVNGSLTLASSNNFTYLEFYPNGGTLGGTGQVIMGGFTPQYDIVDALYGSVTIGPGITIQGAGGTIEGGASSVLTNQGTITANQNGDSITVDYFVNQGRLSAINGAGLTLNTFTNNGTISAAGGTLVLEGNWSNSGVISGNVSTIGLNGTFTTASLGGFVDPGGTVYLNGTLINTSSTLTLSPTNGTWVLNGGTIQGGTVVTTEGTQLVLPGSSSVYLDGITLDSPITVSNGATLVVGSGLTLNSTITLASSNNYTYLEFYPNGGELGGTGQVIMGGFTPQYDIVDALYGSVTIGPGITIQGESGTIEGGASSVLTNQGTITANQNGDSITVDYFVNQGRLSAINGAGLTLNTFTNNGTISAAGGTLVLEGNWSNSGVISGSVSTIGLNGTFTTASLGGFVDPGGTVYLNGTLINTSSTLTLSPTNGTWVLNGGTIQGGTVVTTEGTQLVLPGSSSVYLDGITLDSPITVSNGAALYVGSGLTLNSTISLASSNNYTYLEFYPNGGVLGGTGQVVMGGFTPQYDIVSALYGAVTIGPGITIQGESGTIEGGASSVLTNQGTITANQSGDSITVDYFVNQGRLSAINGAGLTLNTFTNNGTISAAGGTLVLEGNWSNSGVISGSVSTIGLNGTFTTASLGGFVDPGGTVYLNGTLINTSSTLTLSPTNGTWVLNGGTIQGGTVVTTEGTQLILPGSASVYLDGITLDSPITVSNGAALYTDGLTLNSTITLASSNNYTYLEFYPFGGVLGGTGLVVMGGFTPQYDIVYAATGPVTIGLGITIQGAGGTIQGGASAVLTNQGTITANQNGDSIAVDYFVNQGRLSAINGAGLTLNTFTNNGTISAAGGTLVLEGNWSNSGVISGNVSTIGLNGTFTTASLGGFVDPGGTVYLNGTLINTSSTLTLSPTNGTWVLNGGTIQGGTVVTTEGTQLVLPGSSSVYLDGITLDSPITVSNGAALYTDGLTLNSTITLASSNNYTYLEFYPFGGVLGGTGQVVMGGFTPQYDIVYAATGPVTIGPGITIQGAGSIEGAASAVLTNQGTISADTSGGVITLQHFVNQGHLIAFNGGTLYAYYPTNFGAVIVEDPSALQFQGNYVQQGGSTELDGGQLNPANGGSVLILGGSLGGGGFVNAVVTNFGTIDPGPAASALVFASNLVLESSSVLNFQVGGYTPASEYGDIVLSNGVNLAGSLAVTLINDFVPTPGSSFTVLTSGAPITGTFANITSGSRIQTLDGAGSFVYIQNANSIVLDNFQLDSLSNYLAWAQHYFGCTNCAQSLENANGDGNGFDNFYKFASGFNPTNAAAYPHIISIGRVNSNADINVTYLGANGDSSWTPGFASRTNVLQYSTGWPDGSYGSEVFVSTGQTNILSGGTGLGIVTNMVDRGGATNQPARYYRIEVIAP
jgi:hypothetical protein